MPPHSLTYKVSQIISNDWIDALENYFFECQNCPWALQQETPKDPFVLIGYFKDASTQSQAIQDLREAVPNLENAFVTQTMPENEWQEAYKTFVKPWADRTLHWIPLWAKDSYLAPSSAHCVYLDAGMAFGTGSHETTQLCASRLLDYYQALPSDPSNLKIVDAGCGSGILALSAKILGFKNVHGFDNDPDALAVCVENQALNPHIESIHFSVDDLNTGLAEGEIDLLMANIQTDILMPFSTQIIKSLRPNAVLILSGILTTEINALRKHFEAAFKQIRPNATIEMDSRAKGEWSDLRVEILACDTPKIN